MSVATGTALAIGLGATAAGGLGSAIIGSKAAKSAANTQQQGVRDAIDVLNKQYGISQDTLAPYLTAGKGGLDLLTQGLQPGGSLVTPFGETYQTPTPFSYAAFNAPAPFTAPTLDNTNDPGYAFRQQQGEQALQRGAAAGGGGFSGGTLKALTRYGQDYASNEYNNVYNRALTGYQTNFGDALNAYQTNFGNAYNTYNTNVNDALNAYNMRFNVFNAGQGNQFNRLLALSGIGQNAAGSLVNAGQNNSAAIANLITGGANAGAAGTLGSASAWNSGLGALTGGISSAANLFGLRGLVGGSSYNNVPNVPIGGNVPLSVAAGVPTNLWE